MKGLNSQGRGVFAKRKLADPAVSIVADAPARTINCTTGIPVRPRAQAGAEARARKTLENDAALLNSLSNSRNA
jgi:hypothetical protein